MKLSQPVNNDTIVEEGGGELEEGEGEERAFGESRWIAEAEDVPLHFRGKTRERSGRGGGGEHVELKGRLGELFRR